jgi:hypothetical protein
MRAVRTVRRASPTLTSKIKCVKGIYVLSAENMDLKFLYGGRAEMKSQKSVD